MKIHILRRSLVVGATNRKQDLDAALLSRFDMVLTYDLPNKDTRAAIFKRYAKQFAQQHDGGEEYGVLAEASAGLSCRGIKEVCEQVCELNGFYSFYIRIYSRDFIFP